MLKDRQSEYRRSQSQWLFWIRCTAYNQHRVNRAQRREHRLQSILQLSRFWLRVRREMCVRRHHGDRIGRIPVDGRERSRIGA